VRSSSRATAPTVLPLAWTIRTASALNSFVNARRLRLAMDYSYRTFVRSGVSTKPGEVHTHAILRVAGAGGVPPRDADWTCPGCLKWSLHQSQ
jgi:hypothetical protein